MWALLWVGIGGCIGSCLRYVISTYMNSALSSSFPWATFLINVFGSFLIGIVYALGARSMIGSEMRLFLATGICGGFTTFSTFSAETFVLIRDGQLLLALLYVLGSVLAGVLATFCAMALMRTS